MDSDSRTYLASLIMASAFYASDANSSKYVYLVIMFFFAYKFVSEEF